MSTRVTLEQWKVFAAIVEYGSGMNAANALCKSQSALSHSIKKLEESIGCDVFTTQGRNLILTPLGQFLYPKARDLIQQARKTEELIHQFTNNELDEIVIATTGLLGSYINTCILEKLMQRYPEKDISLNVVSGSSLSSQLLDGSVHIAIGSGFNDDQHLMDICDCEYVCVTAPKNLAKAMDHAGGNLRKIIIDDKIRDKTSSTATKSSIRVGCANLALKLLIEGTGYAWIPDLMALPYIKKNALSIVKSQPSEQRTLKLSIGIQSNQVMNQQINAVSRVIQHTVRNASNCVCHESRSTKH